MLIASRISADDSDNGAYYCARVAGEIFRKQGSGNLIFTASMSGHAANVSAAISQRWMCLTNHHERYRNSKPATMLAKLG